MWAHVGGLVPFHGLIANYCIRYLYPSPDVDFVMSILLQSNITSSITKPGISHQPGRSTSDMSGSSKFKQIRGRQPGKRKGYDSMLSTLASSTFQPIFILL